MTSRVAIGFLVATVRLSTPLLIAATGEMFAERGGILNLGVEGMMLTGALAGFLGAYFTGSLILGWLTALLAGGIVALVFAFFAITLRCHQVIVALGLNLLLVGGTGFCYRTLFKYAASTPQVTVASAMAVPFLSRVPWLGPILFQHSLLVYFAFFLPGMAWWVLFRTDWGTMLRAVGENPLAADAVGVRVQVMRYSGTLIGGMMAGLAGAYLSTVDLNVFLEGMTGGIGWIAVAIVIFGNWNPFGILFASLLFGGAQALQLRLQLAGIGLPRELIVMLPYLLTLVALAGAVRKSNAPSQLCIPYFRPGREGRSP
jgi:ABC-type uncharacterized transport system permease subunit